jgi:hypothetical protein
MQGLEALGLALGGIVALVAIVLLALRHSARLRAEERRAVERLDAVMITVAARTGLRHLPGPVHEHPVVGSILGYGRLLGSLRGVQVYVAVERTGDSGAYVDELCIEVACDPAVPPTAETLARLRALGLEVRTTPERLVAVPHPHRGGSMGTLSFDLPQHADELEQYVRATVDAVATPRPRPQRPGNP